MNEPVRKAQINIDRQAIAALCQRHHIRALRLFGSALRDDFTDQSDIDLLVEVDPDHVPGFMHLHVIAEELSELFHGRRIDLVTIRSLSPRLRGQVLSSAEVLFAA
jgi:uncharacterized protein